MKEYIDRAALLDKNMYGNANPITHRTYADQLINSIPASDVRENIHAEWGKPIYHVDTGWTKRCSHCFYSSHTGTKEFKPLFCSNCGATMSLE